MKLYSTLIQPLLLSVCAAALLLCLSVETAHAGNQRVKITKKNRSQFEKLSNKKPHYTCRQLADDSTLLGTLNHRKLRPGTIWKLASSGKIENIIERLQNRLTGLEEREKTDSRKYRKLQKKHSRQITKLDAFRNYRQRCQSGSTPNTSEFLGTADSLAPYRDSLTRNEVRHLLNKVAFGGSPELEQIGVEQGLEALVNALIDGVGGAEASTQLETDSMFWASQLFYYPESEPGYEGVRIWTTEAVQAGQTYRTIFTRNPFREWMLLQLSAHFAVNLNQIGFSYDLWGHYGLELHWKLLQQHAMGNLRELLQAFYLDPAMNFWLDNKDNRVGAPNENYPRELLELFSLGALDPVTHQPNYDEETITGVTAFASGYLDSAQPDPLSGHDVVDIRFLPELHDTAAYTIFRSIPGAEIRQSLSPEGLVDHILDNHPGAPRYLAERFAGQMLYPGLPENIVAQLADTLKSSNYELIPMLRAVLRSSAMFSQESRNVCVTSPLEQMYRLARKIFRTSLPRDTERLENVGWALASFSYEAGAAGQSIFEPPSVFGWKGSCNINRNGGIARGEGWLTSQRVLNRSRACTRFLDTLNWIEFNFVTNLNLQANMSADEIIRSISDNVYGIQLTVEQHAIFKRLMTEERDENGNQQELEVDLEAEWYVRKRIPRLLCMLGDLVEANRR